MHKSTMLRRAFLLSCLALTACHHRLSSVQDVNIAGMLPPLALSMTDVQTGRLVSGADFRGKVTLLYFGYTNCPDVCPATLYNFTRIMQRLGAEGGKFQMLFVTVDPDRDTPSVLSHYAALFGPNIIGLRGTKDQLDAVARRYRAEFSVVKTPTYAVTHSSAVYVFDAQGKPQFLIAGLEGTNPDFKGITADLKSVIGD
ncbi:MAG TPA: SCO family protein [Acidocella sp.]|jgi:protein SCO1/2|uniref:SCO family protein n=1 Tax=Acidocella sp. TaxID=50710 RepID=UPI002D1C8386|nr:SCO family protein [Acidocella sp.]HVE22049.1 SCO family protein [Acidocella sp.]